MQVDIILKGTGTEKGTQENEKRKETDEKTY